MSRGIGVFLLSAAVFFLMHGTAAGQNEKSGGETARTASDIPGPETDAGTEALAVTPPALPVWEQPVFEMLRLPEPVSGTGLSPGQEMKLEQLEIDYAAGKINKLEYQTRQDTILREANIAF